jgi:hypothetical protein
MGTCWVVLNNSINGHDQLKQCSDGQIPTLVNNEDNVPNAMMGSDECEELPMESEVCWQTGRRRSFIAGKESDETDSDSECDDMTPSQTQSVSLQDLDAARDSAVDDNGEGQPEGAETELDNMCGDILQDQGSTRYD